MDSLIEKIPKLNELQNGKKILVTSLFRISWLALLHIMKFSPMKFHLIQTYDFT